MKFIKFTIRGKQSITLSMEKAEQVLSAPTQLVKILDEKGQWTGQSINKVEIITTDRDYDAERSWARDHRPPALPAPQGLITPEQKAEIDRTREEISRKFGIKKEE